MERAIATVPELGTAQVRYASLCHTVAALDAPVMAGLTHRERLQAGTQQLAGELYATQYVCLHGMPCVELDPGAVAALERYDHRA